MTRCESGATVMCAAGTVTPTTRAITPLRPRGMARVAATALPIRGPAEDNTSLVWFRSSPRTLIRSTAGMHYAYVC
jgi:hypothetical protein